MPLSPDEIKPIILKERWVPRKPDQLIVCRCRPFHRPLHAQKITYLIIFSFIAIVLFFPTGIPACYYAFKTKKTFYDRDLKDNFELAIKYSILTERLVICSVLLAVIVGAVSLAMWEKLKEMKDFAVTVYDDVINSL
ncbi:uncharacterized protein LOC121367418 [Gigantopelta aegis]|uniref:uncharacterized protein LOC121367418 n=1 Tax=Gigantopelta aegis TaxID=1735272 RepID=UPI001B88B808|nr:uncharacterized protein LOC121367418 [Gigantopelta aegis]